MAYSFFERVIWKNQMVCCWVLLKDCRVSNQNVLFQWCLTCSESWNPISDSICDTGEFYPDTKRDEKSNSLVLPYYVLFFNYACHLRQIKFHSGYCFSIFMSRSVLLVVWEICSILIILFLKRFASYNGLKQWLWRSSL